MSLGTVGKRDEMKSARYGERIGQIFFPVFIDKFLNNQCKESFRRETLAVEGGGGRVE